MSQTDYGADDPIWIDEAWLDTVVVVGLTCFILCLMNLSKVSEIGRAQADDFLIGMTFSSSHAQHFLLPCLFYRSPLPRWECCMVLLVCQLSLLDTGLIKIFGEKEKI